VKLNDSTAAMPIPMLRSWLREARLKDSLRVMLIRELDEQRRELDEREKRELDEREKRELDERINETKREQREKTLWIVIAAVLGFLIITR
jgi:uncharacterized membrane protein